MSADVAEIARGLAKAQREAVMGTFPAPIPDDNAEWRMWHSLNCSGIVRRTRHHISKLALTPLGLAVIAHLTQEQPR